MDPNQLKAFVDQNDDGGSAPSSKKAQKPKGPTDQELAEQVGKELEAGQTDQDIMDLMLTDFDPSDLPPVWAPMADIWERAMKAVDPEGEGDKWTDPMAVVAHLYKKLGGEVDSNEGAEGNPGHAEPDGDEVDANDELDY